MFYLGLYCLNFFACHSHKILIFIPQNYEHQNRRKGVVTFSNDLISRIAKSILRNAFSRQSLLIIQPFFQRGSKGPRIKLVVEIALKRPLFWQTRLTFRCNRSKTSPRAWNRASLDWVEITRVRTHDLFRYEKRRRDICTLKKFRSRDT